MLATYLSILSELLGISSCRNAHTYLYCAVHVGQAHSVTDRECLRENEADACEEIGEQLLRGQTHEKACASVQALEVRRLQCTLDCC